MGLFFSVGKMCSVYLLVISLSVCVDGQVLVVFLDGFFCVEEEVMLLVMGFLEYDWDMCDCIVNCVIL